MRVPSSALTRELFVIQVTFTSCSSGGKAVNCLCLNQVLLQQKPKSFKTPQTHEQYLELCCTHYSYTDPYLEPTSSKKGTEESFGAGLVSS